MTDLSTTHKKQLYAWEERLERVFPRGTPTMALWTGLPQIFSTLQALSGQDGPQILLPGYGAQTFGWVERSAEEGAIEFAPEVYVEDDDRPSRVYMVRPSMLTFRVPQGGFRDAHFVLLADPVDARSIGLSGVAAETTSDAEEVLNMGGGKYLSSDHFRRCGIHQAGSRLEVRYVRQVRLPIFSQISSYGGIEESAAEFEAIVGRMIHRG